LRFFVVFFSPSRRIPVSYLKIRPQTSYQILYNPSSFTYPIIDAI